MILKPFMLRRVKKHVQNELSDKIELDIYVDLSARQKAMYRTLLSNISVADLLAQAANLSDAGAQRTLMNLVMQFRKVCNHPELFERADVVSPFAFARFGRSGPLNREGDFVIAPYSTRNPIEYSVPELFVTGGGFVAEPQEDYVSVLQPENSVLRKLMNIWTPDHIMRSMREEGGHIFLLARVFIGADAFLSGAASSAFSFLRFIDTTPKEAYALHRAPLIRRRLLGLEDEARHIDSDSFAYALMQ
jgi:DNA helicase INO80